MIGRNIGNYVVLEQVGQGGMGVVYLAEHPLIGRQVAVKVLHPHLAQNPSLVARFFTEARSAYEVRSNNIVEILDFGLLEDKTTYFVMEWLEGRTLASELRAKGRLSDAKTAQIGAAIARALKGAHTQGVVHLDLKPENVMLVQRDDDPDFVKVLDFGISKLMDDEDIGGAKGPAVLMGTPAFMSPEQCQGATDQIDHRSDIYALGVILYEMATGQVPFGDHPAIDVIRRHVYEPAPRPSKLRPDMPHELEALILRALEKDRDNRFQDAGALRAALLEMAPRLSSEEPPPPPPRRSIIEVALRSGAAFEETVAGLPPTNTDVGSAALGPWYSSVRPSSVPTITSPGAGYVPPPRKSAEAHMPTLMASSPPPPPSIPPSPLPPGVVDAQSAAGERAMQLASPDSIAVPAQSEPRELSPAPSPSPSVEGTPAVARTSDLALPARSRVGMAALFVALVLGFALGLIADRAACSARAATASGAR